ncbi:hypothetical protein R8Z50_32970 [Longispora sp. K20-0274]
MWGPDADDEPPRSPKWLAVVWVLVAVGLAGACCYGIRVIAELSLLPTPK